MSQDTPETPEEGQQQPSEPAGAIGAPGVIGAIGAAGAVQAAAEADVARAAARRAAKRRRMLAIGGAAVVVGAAAAAPALAAGSSLPSLTAQQVVQKVLESKATAFSGTVETSTDLGLPSGASSLLASAAPGTGGGGTGGAATGPAALLGALTSGHRLRIAVDGPDRQLVSLEDPGDRITAVHDGDQGWLYDGPQHSAVRATGLGAAQGAGAGAAPAATALSLSPQQAAQRLVQELAPTSTLSVSGTSKVAGRSVYELTIRPKASGSTVSAVRIAVDSATGLPLSVEADAAAGGAPLAQARFTSVSFGRPAASSFAFTPPAGTDVRQTTAAAFRGELGGQDGALGGHGGFGKGSGPSGSGSSGSGTSVLGSGWTAVAVLHTGSGAGGSAGLPDGLGGLGSSTPEGTLIGSRAVNALIAKDGTVYVGAVSPAVLERAARG